MHRSKFSHLLFLSCAILSCSSGCFKSDTKEHYVDLTNYVLQHTMISPALNEILKITNVQHDGTLDSVVQATQQAWLRKPGVERWQIEQKFDELKPQLEPYFKELHIFDEIKPTQKEYNDVIILGATLSSMRTRLQYALDLWNKGIRFKQLIFLVGQRPLDAQKESLVELFDRSNTQLPIRNDWQEPSVAPTTETEAAKMIVDQANLPKEFKESVQMFFIDTPMQQAADGNTRRPNTGDTIKLWLKEMNPQGTILAISNQPYVGYQHAVIKTAVPKELKIETVGPKTTVINVDVFLDNLARWLYQENVYQKSKMAQ
ncbi:MAG: hypothetical protein AB7F19_04460 [Candidatus Babeliales bacterium]